MWAYAFAWLFLVWERINEICLMEDFIYFSKIRDISVFLPAHTSLQHSQMKQLVQIFAFL